MFIFGTISLGAAVVAAAFGDSLVWPYWLVAGLLGSLATSYHYDRRYNSSGLSRKALPYFGVMATLSVGAFGLPFLLAEPSWAIAVWVGACYLGFAWLERSMIVAGTALVLLVSGVVLRVSGATGGAALVSLITGAALLVGAALARRQHLRW